MSIYTYSPCYPQNVCISVHECVFLKLFNYFRSIRVDKVILSTIYSTH